MIRNPEGTYDMLPDEAKFWNIFQNKATSLFKKYGYNQIVTPNFEQTSLFVRGIGEATDVVNKEMFSVISGGNLKKLLDGQSIKDKSILSLRPEGTASVIRSIIQNNLVSVGSAPIKLMYSGPMFRSERPQEGRKRSFMQIGVECVGSLSAYIDAEAIIMLMRFYKDIGFDCDDDISLNINSIGCKKCRSSYRKNLIDFLNNNQDKLCATCLERAKINPLRTLDCKNPNCQDVLSNAPKMLDYLCPECISHFDEVKDLLNKFDIAYTIEPKLVRGLDYYTKTVFEITSSDVGSQDALAGGGRYDGLVKELGGPNLAGFGFALGYERTLIALKNKGLKFEPAIQTDVFVAAVDKNCRKKAFECAQTLRDNGISVEIDYQNKSLKSQFKLASKLNCLYVIVLGPDEIKKGIVCIRDMSKHTQVEIKNDKLFAFFSDMK